MIVTAAPWGWLEPGWFSTVNEFATDTPWLHTPLRLFAQYGIVLFAGVFLLSWWRARATHDPRAVALSLWAPLGALVALGINQPISHLVAEPRPYDAHPNALVLVAKTTDFSFPSDHAVMAGAVAVGVLLVNRRMGIWVTGLALLMAFTRVYVGAHYPGDVIVGLLLGGAVAALTSVVGSRVMLPIVALVHRSPLRPLVATQEVPELRSRIDSPLPAAPTGRDATSPSPAIRETGSSLVR